MMATPSYMLTVADGLQEQGIDPASTTLRIGVFGAEPVIDFEVTPNRPDWLGVNGIARDLAAAGLGALKTPAIEACPE